ncbi:hypothetical protein PYCCODRAFT_206019 [Trametes coccinea BRFM310]|uniref:Uncharacterized protein n=1 Tax=Trametes coccinea (strain BRFM310) TaxID=1353009 RepID=A0A1Y2IRS5_TRAC3|nr:hypothetical protein PYCCODRAFT_206019 [Trametes coccinea BRFM310]
MQRPSLERPVTALHHSSYSGGFVRIPSPLHDPSSLTVEDIRASSVASVKNRKFHFGLSACASAGNSQVVVVSSFRTLTPYPALAPVPREAAIPPRWYLCKYYRHRNFLNSLHRTGGTAAQTPPTPPHLRTSSCGYSSAALIVSCFHPSMVMQGICEQPQRILGHISYQFPL